MRHLLVKKIAAVGCSGHAKVVVDAIKKAKLYQIVGFLDSYKAWGSEFCGYGILGTCENVPGLLAEGRIEGGVVAIGDNWLRAKIVERLLELAPAFPFVSAIHPSAQIGANVEIGRGTVVSPL